MTYFYALNRTVRKHLAQGFDVIDAHYAFPDGAAAVLLSRAIGKPVVLTVRGSDINLFPDDLFAGPWIRWTLANCNKVVAVSDDLAAKVRRLIPTKGIDVRVLRNGVDQTRFRILNRRLERFSGLRGCGRIVLSVGNLIKLKGHHLVLEAIRDFPEVSLIVIGKGPMRDSLYRMAHELGVASRFRIVDEMPQDELVEFYNAADVLVLASSSEGLPNVLLEALACGTPAIATAVGGVKEVLRHGRGGLLLADRSVEAIREQLSALFANPGFDRKSVREQVSAYDWEQTSKALKTTLQEALIPQRKLPSHL